VHQTVGRFLNDCLQDNAALDRKLDDIRNGTAASAASFDHAMSEIQAFLDSRD